MVEACLVAIEAQRNDTPRINAMQCINCSAQIDVDAAECSRCRKAIVFGIDGLGRGYEKRPPGVWLPTSSNNVARACSKEDSCTQPKATTNKPIVEPNASSGTTGEAKVDTSENTIGESNTLSGLRIGSRVKRVGLWAGSGKVQRLPDQNQIEGTIVDLWWDGWSNFQDWVIRWDDGSEDFTRDPGFRYAFEEVLK
jgi:hypothetical protein